MSVSSWSKMIPSSCETRSTLKGLVHWTYVFSHSEVLFTCVVFSEGLLGTVRDTSAEWVGRPEPLVPMPASQSPSRSCTCCSREATRNVEDSTTYKSISWLPLLWSAGMYCAARWRWMQLFIQQRNHYADHKSIKQVFLATLHDLQCTNISDIQETSVGQTVGRGLSQVDYLTRSLKTIIAFGINRFPCNRPTLPSPFSFPLCYTRPTTFPRRIHSAR